MHPPNGLLILRTDHLRRERPGFDSNPYMNLLEGVPECFVSGGEYTWPTSIHRSPSLSLSIYNISAYKCTYMVDTCGFKYESIRINRSIYACVSIPIIMHMVDYHSCR